MVGWVNHHVDGLGLFVERDSDGAYGWVTFLSDLWGPVHVEMADLKPLAAPVEAVEKIILEHTGLADDYARRLATFICESEGITILETK